MSKKQDGTSLIQGAKNGSLVISPADGKTLPARLELIPSPKKPETKNYYIFVERPVPGLDPVIAFPVYIPRSRYPSGQPKVLVVTLEEPVS